MEPNNSSSTTTIATKDEKTSSQPCRTAFGCCTLRTSALICGIICLMASLSALITSVIYYVEYKDANETNVNTFLSGVVGAIVSALCIHAAIKEYRYNLLPWMVVFAMHITMNYLTGFYFILYRNFEAVMTGIVQILESALLTYWWICIANYYTELRDRENNSTVTPPAMRSYINPSAVTNPFSTQLSAPPPYTVATLAAYSVMDEKPPCYAEAEQMEKRAEQMEKRAEKNEKRVETPIPRDK